MKRVLGAGFVLVALAGCASPGAERPGPEGMHGRRHGGPPGAFGPSGARPAALFISPCGRPYRSTAGEPYPVGVWFAAADTNHDGRLDRAEFRADADLFFQVLDRDHDGVVAGEEVTFYEQRIVPEILAGPGAQAANAAPDLLIKVQMQGGGMPGGGGGGRRGGSRGGGPQEGGGPSGGGRPPGANMTGAAAYTFLREPEPVTASDGNFDHRITAAEFSAAADRRFKLLDKDGDGALTLETLPPTPVQRMGPGGERGGERGGRGGGRHRPPGRQG